MCLFDERHGSQLQQVPLQCFITALAGLLVHLTRRKGHDIGWQTGLTYH